MDTKEKIAILQQIFKDGTPVEISTKTETFSLAEITEIGETKKWPDGTLHTEVRYYGLHSEEEGCYDVEKIVSIRRWVLEKDEIKLE